MNMFSLDSKEELDKKGSISPLCAEDYIIKVVKVDLRQEPTFKNRQPDYSKLTWSFRLICLPVALKAGGDMETLDKREALPFTKYIFRNISPFSTGFRLDRVTPSLCRGFIAHMEGMDVNDSIKTPDFVLLDPDHKVIEDEEIRNKFITELKAEPDVAREMLAQGYKGIPDLRAYEGKYISSTIEVEVKGEKKLNKITRFTKLPASFTPLTEEASREPLEKFKKFYDEKIVPRDVERHAKLNGGGSPNSQSVVQDNSSGEVIKEEVPF